MGSAFTVIKPRLIGAPPTNMMPRFPALIDTNNYCNIGALINRTGFWGPLCYNCNKAPIV